MQVQSAMLWVTLGTAALRAPGQEPQPAADEARWFRNVRQLTRAELGLARAGEAYFSPDCRRISFQAIPTGQEDYQIYVINVDGSGLKRVSTGVGATTCSFFHPSGEKLIFAANHDDLRMPQRPEELEPTRPRQAAATTQPAADASAGPGGPQQAGAAAGQGHGGVAPQEGRGGGQAGGGAAGGGRGGSYAWKYFPGMEIYEYSFAQDKLTRLTNSDAYDAECAFSPDGKRIVFSSLRDGDQEIYISAADGSNPRRITHAPGGDGGPFFSPDGKRIVYRSDRFENGNLQIFTNNLEGTDEKAVTNEPAIFHWCPFWHPSGKWIIYTRADFSGRPNFDLYLVRPDGSDPQRVTTNPDSDVLPVFSPDGRYLMWTAKRNGIDSPQIFIAEVVGLKPDGTLVAQP